MNPINNMFVAAVFLLSIHASLSAAEKVVPPGAATSRTGPSVTNVKQTEVKAQSHTASALKVRLVDINSAGRNELRTLPGVSNEIADRIIAGRPFGSKAQLTTRGILSRDVYEDLKGLVVAKQDAGTTAKLLKK